MSGRLANMTLYDLNCMLKRADDHVQAPDGSGSVFDGPLAAANVRVGEQGAVGAPY
jgi:hypothetical protein